MRGRAGAGQGGGSDVGWEDGTITERSKGDPGEERE